MDARKAMASSYYYMSTTIGDDSLRSIYGPMPKLLTGIYGDVDVDKVDNNDEFNIFLQGISCVNTAGYPYLLQSDASDVCQVQEQANGDPYLSVKCGNADLNVNLKGLVEAASAGNKVRSVGACCNSRLFCYSEQGCDGCSAFFFRRTGC